MPSISDKFAAELDRLMQQHEASKIRLDNMLSNVRAYRKEIERLHEELLTLEAEL